MMITEEQLIRTIQDEHTEIFYDGVRICATCQIPIGECEYRAWVDGSSRLAARGSIWRVSYTTNNNGPIQIEIVQPSARMITDTSCPVCGMLFDAYGVTAYQALVHLAQCSADYVTRYTKGASE